MTLLGNAGNPEAQAQATHGLSALWYAIYAQASEAIPDVGVLKTLRDVGPEVLYAAAALLGMLIIYRALPAFLRRFDVVTERKVEKHARLATLALDQLDLKLNGEAQSSKLASIVRMELEAMFRDHSRLTTSVANCIGEVARHKVFNSPAFVENFQLPLDRLIQAENHQRAWRDDLETRMGDAENKGIRLEEHLAHISTVLEDFRRDLRSAREDFVKALEASENRIMNAIQMRTGTGRGRV